MLKYCRVLRDATAFGGSDTQPEGNPASAGTASGRSLGTLEGYLSCTGTDTMHAPKTMRRLGENGMSSLWVFKGLLNDIDIVLLTLDHAKTRCCENKWMLEHPFES